MEQAFGGVERAIGLDWSKDLGGLERALGGLEQGPWRSGASPWTGLEQALGGLEQGPWRSGASAWTGLERAIGELEDWSKCWTGLERAQALEWSGGRLLDQDLGLDWNNTLMLVGKTSNLFRQTPFILFEGYQTL